MVQKIHLIKSSVQTVKGGLLRRMVEEIGFIPEFRDFLLDHVPTSRDWAESIAISLLSTAVGGDVFVRSKIGHLKLNLWFLMVGPSGISYKSVPLNYYVFPVLTRLTEELKEQTIMPSRFSIEGIIQWLTKHPQGNIVRDEFTTIFKETTKGYLSDILEFLSELYDGRMQKRFTRKMQLEEVTNVYVNFLGATTPYLYRIMKPDFFIQGTGNRILIVKYEGLDEKTLKERPEDFFYDIQQDILKNEKLVGYAKELAKIRQSPVEQLVPMQDAGQKWLDFREKITIRANEMFKSDIYNLKYTYIMRLGEFTLKLSGLHAISLHYKKLQGIGREMPIMVDDMEWAIQKIKNYYKHFEDLLSDWKPEEQAEPMSLGDAISRLYNVLCLYQQGMMWEEIKARFTWESRFLKEAILSLFEQRKVGFAVGTTESGKGRKPTVVYVKKFEKTIDNLGYEKLEGWDQFAYRVHFDKV